MSDEEQPASPAVRPGRNLRWWRWLAGFWLVLGAAGAAVRHWNAVGLAGLFLTGFLAQEVRAVQHEERSAPLRAGLLALLTAVLGAGSVYLELRYTFDVPLAWWVVLIIFAALLVLYAGGPTLVRRARDRPPRPP